MKFRPLKLALLSVVLVLSVAVLLIITQQYSDTLISVRCLMPQTSQDDYQDPQISMYNNPDRLSPGISSYEDSFFKPIKSFGSCKTLRMERNIQTPSQVERIVLLPNGDLASGHADGAIRIWDKSTGWTLKQTLARHSSQMRGLVALANSDLISSSTHAYDGILVWNISSGMLKKKIDISNECHYMIVMPYGRQIACNTYPHGDIEVWDIDSGELLTSMTGTGWSWSALVILPNGNLASQGESSETIVFIDPNDGEVKQTLQSHTGHIDSLILLNSSFLVSGSSDKGINVWNINSGKLVMKLPLSHSPVLSLAVLPNGYLVAGHYNSLLYDLQVWDLNSASLVAQVPGHTNHVNGFVLLPNGSLISGSVDRTIRIWSCSK